jgi:DNA replication protein DnaT
MSWIKLETHTPEKPEIFQIAKLCNTTTAEAFMAFVRFLSHADRVTTDGYIDFITAEEVDRISGLPGFGFALEEVRWAVFYENGGIQLAKWERHNGQSAKRRLIEAERKRQHRGRVQVDDSSN